jgi:5-methylcytosine-specific restriction endonuclease McrA
MTDEQREAERQKTRERVRSLGFTDAKRSSGQRRRAIKVGATVERFTAQEIYERDAWVCGICDQPIDRTLKHPDPNSVSLDHIQPLSLGGEHSRANTRAAHLGCNVRRGNRVAA